MAKRRKNKRVHLIYYLLVFDNDSDQLVGHIVDITTDGIKLMSRIPLIPDKIYNFKMILPEGIDETSREISFKAKSRWCKDKMYSDFYGIGFKFEDISEEDITTIKHLIDQFGYVE